MIIIRGTGVSNGIARGPLYFFRPLQVAAAKNAGADAETEKLRLARAQAHAVAELTRLADRCRAENEEAALLLETHAMFVEDEDFVSCIHAAIDEENCCAEYAVERAGEQFAALFADMEDPYMQARAADVRDVVRYLVEGLTGAKRGGIDAAEPVILCADDLSPADTLQMDREKLLGFVTREGSEYSHTAILARSMGIPALCAVGDGLREEFSGMEAYLDGEGGQLILQPDAATQAELEAKYAAHQELKLRLESVKWEEDITPDGRKILLFCNIGSPEDVSAVLKHGGRGIGLFRSEFLFLGAEAPPDEEEQFAAYRAVVEAMEGKQVVIRTLDIGADKQADYLGLKREENPALGLRGIRLCLSRPDLFRTQLRAIYRASAFGKAAILFPMITSVWEVRACKEICRSVMAELEAEGVPFDTEVEIGVMIETPAAVLTAEELAAEVDFFSVGTNDLTQYTLACDRQSGDLGQFCDPHHPALLRSLKLVADAAHAAGIRVAVCGELAADLTMLDTFLDIGIDELSVAPAAILPLRAAIRAVSV